MNGSVEQATRRRWIGRLVQAGLIAIVVIMIGSWLINRVPNRGRVELESEPVAEAALGPGDLRIYNSDSTVNLILRGNAVLAGLSPKVIAKVRAEVESSAAGETSGLGGSIAAMVKKTVASAIATHVVYPLSEIRDLRFEDGQIIIERVSGGDTRLFGNVKVDDDADAKRFRREDAEQFIQAVRARKKSGS